MLALAEDVILDGRGAAWFPEDGLLAVSDLHVGYEAAFAARGMALPPVGLEALLGTLTALLDAYRPDVLLMNGDVKHGYGARLLSQADDVRALWRHVAARVERVIVVEGNHDGGLGVLLPDAHLVERHEEGRFVFAHGHQKRLPVLKDQVRVLGHEHPRLTLKDEVGATVRLPAFLHGARSPSGPETLVLPALSPWAAGVDVLDERAFASPLLAGDEKARYRTIGCAEGDALDFGRAGRLRKLLG